MKWNIRNNLWAIKMSKRITIEMLKIKKKMIYKCKEISKDKCIQKKKRMKMKTKKGNLKKLMSKWEMSTKNKSKKT